MKKKNNSAEREEYYMHVTGIKKKWGGGKERGKIEENHEMGKIKDGKRGKNNPMP